MGARPIELIPTPTMAFPLSGTPNDVISGNNGTWGGTTAYSRFSNGQYGADFEGTVSYIEVPHNANQLLTGGFTLAFRVKADTVGETSGRVIQKSSSAIASTDGLFVISTGVGNFSMSVNGGYQVATTGCIYGKEYYLVLVVSAAGAVQWYVNGVPNASGNTGACSGITTITNMFIGSNNTGATRCFDGLIGDFDIWNSALTAAQAAELYTRSKAPRQNPAQIQLPIAARSPYGSPAGAWGFNGGRGFEDVSGNGLDLTNYGLQLTASGGFKNDGTAGKYAVSPGTWSNAANSPISYNFWAKFKYNAVSAFRCPFCIDAWNTGIGVLHSQSPNTINFYGKGGTSYVSSIAIKPDAWNMVSFIYDGSIVKCFVNGVNVYTSAAGETLSAQTNKYVKLLIGNLSTTYNFTDEVRGLQVKKAAWDDSVIPILYNAGVPAARENELFNTHNFSRDLSVNNVEITRYGGAKITRDGLLCDGDSGGAYIADKIGVGDVTIYVTIYPTNIGEGGTGRILDNGKFRVHFNSSVTQLSITNEGSVIGAKLVDFPASLLNVPKRICITRRSNGLTALYANAVIVGSETSSNAPAAATTDLYVGNRSADDRTFAGLISDLRINSGIDTAAQRIADNNAYGFR